MLLKYWFFLIYCINNFEKKMTCEKILYIFRMFDAADPKKLILQKALQLAWCTLDYGSSLIRFEEITLTTHPKISR